LGPIRRYSKPFVDAGLEIALASALSKKMEVGNIRLARVDAQRGVGILDTTDAISSVHWRSAVASRAAVAGNTALLEGAAAKAIFGAQKRTGEELAFSH